MSTTENARQRLVAFVTILKASLSVNPKAATSAIAKQVGVDNGTGTVLVDMGVIRKDGDGYAWSTTDAIEKIVDDLILARRERWAGRGPAAAPNADVAALRVEMNAFVTETRDAIASLNKAIAELRDRPVFGKDESELLDLVLSDQAGVTGRVAALETNMGDVLRRVSAAGGSHTPAPAAPRKVRVGVMGVYPRDMRHIESIVKLELNGHAHVELDRIDHVGMNAKIPTGLLGVVICPTASNRRESVAKVYPLTTYQASGGIRSVGEMVAQMVNTEKGGSK